MDTVNTELIRGHVDTIILRSLLDGDSYPYEILREISEKSEGRYELKQPTLYSSMKRLEKQGLITSYWGTESEGGRRRYYSLTDQGREYLQRDQSEWEYSRTLIDRLLSDKEFDLKNGKAPFEASELRPLTRRASAKTEETVETEETELQVLSDREVAPAIEEEEEEVDNGNSDLLISNPYLLHKSDPEAQIVEDSFVETSIGSAQPITTASLEQEIQQRAASKMLQIGDFAQQATWEQVANLAAPHSATTQAPEVNKSDVAAAAATPTVTVEERPTIKSFPADAEYRQKLEELYPISKEQKATEEKIDRPTVKITKIEPEVVGTSVKQFNDLKTTLLQEGYRLRSYSKPNAVSQQYMQYIYINQIRRDSYLMLFAVMLINFAFALGFHAFQSVWVNTLLGIGIFAVPCFAIGVWIYNPNKRIRSNFNFGYSLILKLVTAALVILVAIAICLLMPNINLDFSSFGMYVIWLYALDIPLYAVIFAILYKSGKYHLS